MTIDISANNPRISYSVAAGVTQTSFAVPFEFFDDSDLNVYIDTTLQTITTNYTVTGGAGSTGTVTMTVTGPKTVIFTRDTTIERTTDFTAGVDINRAALNTQLDTLTAISADNKDLGERSIRITDYDPAAANLLLPDAATRADKLLSFDTEGDIQVQAAGDLLTGSILGANYTKASHTGNGTQTAYSTVESAGSKNNIQVYIDGVYQNKDTFSISGSTLTFSEAPPLNSAIEFIVGNAVTSITGDASAITYDQGGTGAQERTVKSKLQEFVSVKDFGAVGDGVTDDHAAIQAALNVRGKVYFPEGTYIISNWLKVFSNTHLEFDQATIKVSSSVVIGDNFEAVFTMSDHLNGEACHDILISNATVDLNNAPAANGFNIRDDAYNIRIDNAHVKNAAHAKTGYKGGRAFVVEAGTDSLANPDNVVVTNFIVEDSYNAISIAGNADSPGKNIVFSGGVVENCESLLLILGNSTGFPHDNQEAGWVVTDINAYNVGKSVTYARDHGVFNFLRGCNGVISNVRIANDSTYDNDVDAVFYGEMANVVADNIVYDGDAEYIVRLSSWAEADSLPAYKYGSRKLNFRNLTVFGTVTDTVYYNYTYDAGLSGAEGDANPTDNYFDITVTTISGSRLLSSLMAGYPKHYLRLREFTNNAFFDGFVPDGGNGLSLYYGVFGNGGNFLFANDTNNKSEGVTIQSYSPVITYKDITGSAHWVRTGVDANFFNFEISTDSGSNYTSYYGFNSQYFGPTSGQDNDQDLGASDARWDAMYGNRLVLVDGITAPSTITGHAQIYVDTSDGDLKIKYADGTVKTIVVDT